MSRSEALRNLFTHDYSPRFHSTTLKGKISSVTLTSMQLPCLIEFRNLLYRDNIKVLLLILKSLKERAARAVMQRDRVLMH